MVKICIVFEANADAELGCRLADRILVDCIDWLREEPALLQYQREWFTEFEGRQFRWDSIDDIGREMNIRVRGYEDGEKNHPDFKAAVRALQVIRNLFDDVAAVVLIRDADDQSDREDGLKQARDRYKDKPEFSKVVIGCAKTKRECWVLSGFVPCNDSEIKRLAEERQCLGFNPVEKSHELTAKHSETSDKRSAKRVLTKLTKSDFQREEECWTKTPLDKLRANGETNGLSAYLKEVEDILVPLVIRPEGRGAVG